jgi:helix-turn-helix protein
MSVDGALARRAWRPLETLHGMIYFAAEAPEEFAKLGVEGRWPGYFGSRSAAMGPAPAEVVIATFFNFHPARVRKAMDGLWDRTTPAAMIDARLTAVDRALRRLLGDEVVGSSEMRAAADGVRAVAEAASDDVVGRPLFAAHAALPWPEPDPPHVVLWHGAALVREHRGDGHVAALVSAGLDGCEALVSHAASGDVPGEALQRSRGWSDEEWQAAVERLKERGLVDGSGAFTEEGRAQRERIEAVTDERAVKPWAAVGEDAALRLRDVCRPLAKALLAAGAFG